MPQEVNQPDQCKRRVLLISTGGSPAVITETLYGLIRQPAPFIPTEIQIITTAFGRNAIKQHLFADSLSQVEQLWSIYKPLFNGQQPPAFSLDKHVHVFRDADNGSPLEDITEAPHCNQAASLTKRVLFKLFDQNDTAVHCSLSGGRKSMSFYLGYLFCLGGRSQDRLSQTLLKPPMLEYDKTFFYPHPTEDHSSEHPNTNKKTVTKREDIHITIVNIPFEPLSGNEPFREALSDPHIDYNQALAIAKDNRAVLGFDSRKQCLTIQGAPFEPAKTRLYYYLLLLLTPEGVSVDNFSVANAELVCAIFHALSGKAPVPDFFNQHIRMKKSRQNYFTGQKTKIIKKLNGLTFATAAIQPKRVKETNRHFISDPKHIDETQPNLTSQLKKEFNLLPDENGHYRSLTESDINYIQQNLNQPL